jgi:hypothetical protein
VRNTQGDHIEQTFGPGQQSLAAVRLSRNVLAGLCHTVLPWSAAAPGVGQAPDLLRGDARLDALNGV